MSDFKFNRASGTLFPGASHWRGEWSEDGGNATHDIALGEKDGEHHVAFRKIGSKGWTYRPITLVDGYKTQALQGSIEFKGTQLFLWLNYAKDHEGEAAHMRIDIKPRSQVAVPWV